MRTGDLTLIKVSLEKCISIEIYYSLIEMRQTGFDATPVYSNQSNKIYLLRSECS